MNSDDKGWIGVDLDGTLARFRDGDWTDITNIGEPIPSMVERVKQWLATGEEVRVFTARACAVRGVRDRRQITLFKLALHEWTYRHIGVALEATATKDFRMKQLWDDRAVQVEPNTGRAVQDMGTPCPVCGEEAVGCRTFKQRDIVIRRQLGCVNCRTLFEPVVRV